VSAGAIVLAAGQGARLGGVAKALLPGPGGLTYLARIVATCQAAGIPAGRVRVVVGAPFSAEVAAEAARLGAVARVNPAPARGMASSVAVGFAGLPAGWSRALLWPVDHPAVDAATVARLLAVAAAEDLDVVVPRHAGRGGHPVVVAPPVWPALAGCAEAGAGARGVLRDRRWRRRDLPLEDPGVVADVDGPDDLARRW
jgi:molybdenum cofactor cytidylyltransferase